MAEAEIIALREALYKQAETIQKLSLELEEERTAAASGADEALLMILRLQEEKALEKMEASQYKRMSEAKLLHADKSLSSLKEAMFEKDVEIATLKYHLQSYRRKLLSSGIRDPDDEEVEEFVVGSNARVRRQISLPTYWFDNVDLELGMIHDQFSKCFPYEPIVEEITYDLEEAQDDKGEFLMELNTEEKTILHNELKANMIIDTLCSGEKSSNSLDKSLEGPDGILNSTLRSTKMQKSCHPMFIHDIYEVPKCSKVNTMKAKQKAKVSCTFPQDVAELLGNNDFSNRPLPLSIQNAEKHQVLEKESLMTSLAINPINTSQSDVEQLKERVQLLEHNQRVMEENLQRNNEELCSLRGLHEQLNVVQSQIKVSKPMKLSQQDEILLSSITEALLSFAI